MKRAPTQPSSRISKTISPSFSTTYLPNRPAGPTIDSYTEAEETLAAISPAFTRADRVRMAHCAGATHLHHSAGRDSEPRRGDSDNSHLRFGLGFLGSYGSQHRNAGGQVRFCPTWPVTDGEVARPSAMDLSLLLKAKGRDGLPDGPHCPVTGVPGFHEEIRFVNWQGASAKLQFLGHVRPGFHPHFLRRLRRRGAL